MNARAIPTADSRFHTPRALARLLVSLVPRSLRPSDAVDICCGSWSLLTAARNRWPSIRVVGVDRDPQSGLANHDQAEFLCGDGRTFALQCAAIGRQFDLALANPPFGRTDEASQWRSLTANLKRGNRASHRLEAQMLYANALLVRKGGVLAAIVPSSIVQAEMFRNLRVSIARHLRVICLVRLPRRCFPGHEVSCHIVVLKKTRRAFPLAVGVWSAHEQDGVLTTERESLLWQWSIRQGLWQRAPTHHRVRRSEVHVFRGAVSSSDLTDLPVGEAVLHTSGRPTSGKHWEPGLRYRRSEATGEDALPKARAGDVVVARVGRSAGYWTVYEGDPIAVTDCLLVVRGGIQQSRIVGHLQSASASGRLEPLVKGVGAQYVAQSDLIAWLSGP